MHRAGILDWEVKFIQLSKSEIQLVFCAVGYCTVSFIQIVKDIQKKKTLSSQSVYLEVSHSKCLMCLFSC